MIAATESDENRIIAEFMNMTITRYSEFYFDSKWDWLMPVVEKIESLKHPVYISSNNCQIYEKISWGEHNGWNVDSYGKNKLEATYLAVVEFIKWHNKLIINK